MDALSLSQWLLLHRKIVMGEPVSPTDRAAYDHGWRELDSAELLDGDLGQLRELRNQIALAEGRQAELRQREAELDARIASLERHLDERTRQLLGIRG